MEYSSYTVVVAEDEILLLENLINKINNMHIGFEVIGKAQTGIQAYEIIKQAAPDLLITDIKMPVMNGIELIQKCHEKYPLMKFIIISGFSDFAYAKCAIQLQVSEYLLKPVEPEELKKALTSLRQKFEIEQKTYEEIFNPNTAYSTPEQIARLLKEYLVQNYNIDINLNLIANGMNYSSSYLTKIFCQQYETTPSRYIMMLRISRAKHCLIHKPSLSIRQIGELIGYHDQAYFSRIFKKQVGISPYEFREKQNG